jgi:hypothetical protein
MCLESVLKGYVRGQLGRAPFGYHIDSEGLSRRGGVYEIRCFCSRRCCEGACSQPFLLDGNCVTEGLKTDMVAAPSRRLCSLKPQDECPDDGLEAVVKPCWRLAEGLAKQRSWYHTPPHLISRCGGMNHERRLSLSNRCDR